MARGAGGAGHVASYAGCTVMGEVHKGLACAPGALHDSVVIAFSLFCTLLSVRWKVATRTSQVVIGKEGGGERGCIAAQVSLSAEGPVH